MLSFFDHKRLPASLFQIDKERIRKGWYTDAYFLNQIRILQQLAEEGYRFSGRSDLEDVDCSDVDTGNIEVEMQIFTRRSPGSLIVGTDEALSILESCTGYFDKDGKWVDTYDHLEVWAVEDGVWVPYEGDPSFVKPVMKIRGRYREIGHLETVILGVLSEPTRIATNVLNVLEACNGKDVLFFPARYVHYKMQAIGGYAFSLGVQAYNYRHGRKESKIFVSTDAQGEFWGGRGGGTISHAAICCFLGDTVETMLQFARVLPRSYSRIALVDFHNDVVGETKAVLKAMFDKYLEYKKQGNEEEAEKYRLLAVRPDTGGNMRDKSISPLGAKELDLGVNPRMVWKLREALDTSYLTWDLPAEDLEEARKYCQGVKITVTGGFDVNKIKLFESLKVPVDIYGVGSSLLTNCTKCGTNNDFTADIVRVKVGGDWHPMAKAGRRACENPLLKRIK